MVSAVEQPVTAIVSGHVEHAVAFVAWTFAAPRSVRHRVGAHPLESMDPNQIYDGQTAAAKTMRMARVHLDGHHFFSGPLISESKTE